MDMKRHTKLADAASVALVAGTFALTAALYPSLPAVIPTHFDLDGVPNGWMPRTVGAWLIPIVAAGLAALLRFGALVLPSAWRARLEQSPTAPIATMVVALLGALQCVILYTALARPLSMGAWINAILALSWIGLGLVFPRVRRNPWIGVRTPWSLSSDENWARTHRCAGYTFTLGGIVALLCTFASLASLSFATLLVSALLPAFQSYWFARHEKEA
jgi:uncharacterized membrane protein